MHATSDPDVESRPVDPIRGWRDGFVQIGDGELGGKAHGLVFFREMLHAEYDPARHPEIEVTVPSFLVLTTAVFDAFVRTHGLDEQAVAGDDDHCIARRFQQAALPPSVRSILDRLLEHVRSPLAVRSSSLLEDAIFCPFAGVYETKMIPNNQSQRAARLERLELAIKLVFASTFYRGARSTRAAMGKDAAGEKMAVIVQEVVGNTRGERFYPCLSGVGRSHDFYSVGSAEPEDGVVHLALGLGKTIVDGGVTWSYSPSRPTAAPPFASARDMLRNSQLRFWSVRLDSRAAEAPTEETEFLVESDLATAERDGSLALVASTYDPRSDRVVPGTGPDGPRIVNFAPLLTLGLLPFNDVVRELLAIGERAAGREVEVEFAMRAAADGGPARLGLLQVRPMAVSHEEITIDDDAWSREDVLLTSERTLGNGVEEGIRDVVFVKRDGFESRHTPAIAAEIERINRTLLDAGRPYLLIGFGRWGSSDPWLGIPVDWGQICGARVIVEATLPGMNVDASQGSHFFHNISSQGIAYFTIRHERGPGIDWGWLEQLPVRMDTGLARHVELEQPLLVKVDGRRGRGAVWREVRP
jgi:hypothetical protein